MSEPAPRAISVADYLRSERESPYKREYAGGFVYPLHAQAGASRAHGRVCMNIGGQLYPDAMRSGCRLYQSDMQLYTPGSQSFFYPDVMAVCSSDGQDDPYHETLPCLLVEVLSGSTASNDRRIRYAAYTSVPSLQTYLIVSQDERYVSAYERQGEQWNLRELRGVGGVEIVCLGRTLTLDQIYAAVL